MDTQLELSFISYRDIRQRMHRHALRQTEIPTEHEVSLPLPTCRWGPPAFAFFASPALRQPGLPAQQSPPDRWWALQAHGGQLLVYSLFNIIPFAPGVQWTTAEIPPPAPSVAAIRQMLTDIEDMADVLTPDFFRGAPGDAETRRALIKVFKQFVPEPIIEQYRALAPDFCTWLER